MRISRPGWVTRSFVTCLCIMKHFRNVNADPVPENSTELKSSLKQTLQQETFKDWQTWGTRYPNCNSDTNPNLSPIEINSKEATPLNTARAIIVSVGGVSPENCYFLSSVYTTSYMEMDAVNIVPSPACQDFQTYISGAGEGARDYRYFRRAVFYFTNSPVEPPHSLHKIDGKQFDMEIEMEFTDSSGENITLISLMVETLPPDETSLHVGFTPLEFAISGLKVETTNNYVPILSLFQISWLFPQSGGYYLYNGSRSIPDCEPVQHSIVFEKPIQITKDQLAVFQSISSRSGANVDQMIPALRSAENRKVWYVNKDVYYRQTDGLHLPSEPRPAAILLSENQGVRVEFRNTMYYVYAIILFAL